jgi:competence CoiA-like predicted nuclease
MDIATITLKIKQTIHYIVLNIDKSHVNVDEYIRRNIINPLQDIKHTICMSSNDKQYNYKDAEVSYFATCNNDVLINGIDDMSKQILQRQNQKLMKENYIVYKFTRWNATLSKKEIATINYVVDECVHAVNLIIDRRKKILKIHDAEYIIMMKQNISSIVKHIESMLDILVINCIDYYKLNDCYDIK